MNKDLLQMIPKEQFIKIATEATNKMFGAIESESSKEQSKRSIELLNTITKECKFGCNEPSVVKLIEVITGENLMQYYTKSNLVDLVDLAVCYNEEEGLFIVVNSDHDDVLSMNDSKYLLDFAASYIDSSETRRATPEEIVTIIDWLYTLK